LVFLLAAASLRVHWSRSRLYALGGDEYKYPTVSRSLWVYRSRDVRHADLEAFRKNLFIRWGHPKSVAGSNGGVAHTAAGYFSSHGLGLPFLLGPGVVWNETAGARATMVCIALAVPVIAYLVLRTEGCRPTPSALLAIALGVSAPLLAHSTQIYPDLPGGVIAAAALLLVVRRTRGFVESAPVRYAALAVVAFMPWLHVRFLLPCLLLTGGLIAARRTVRLRSAVVECIPFAVATVALFAYNIYAFGSVFGWYSTSASPVTPGWSAFSVFLGLNVDRFQGLFVQQPLLLFAIPGAVLLFRRAISVGLLVAALYLGFLVPNALHPNWYGGASFAGRFGLSAAVILIVPAGVALAALARRRAAFAYAVAASALAVNAWMLSRIWNGSLDLVSPRPGSPRSIYPSWIPMLGRSLPIFNLARWVRTFTPNYIVPIALLTLAIGSVLFANGRRQGGTVVVVLSLAAFVVPTTSAIPTFNQDIAGFRGGHTGRLLDGDFTATPGDAPGLLAIGPTFRMPATWDWTVRVQYSGSARTSENAGAVRLTTDRVVWCSVPLPGTGSRAHRVEVRWRHRSIAAPLKIQVLFGGHASMQLDHVAVSRGRLRAAAARCRPEPGALHRYNSTHRHKRS
jgi:hypothetical protein